MSAHGNATFRSNAGFTLIELSIVLVIIGLLAGGVLVGQDLIRAAEVRATVSQVEKFNTAAHTFQGKYDGALPGDINAGAAVAYGFAPRGQYAGEGDGNGVLEGVGYDIPGNNSGIFMSAGETAMFWSDLTYANGMNINLIEGTYNGGTPTGSIGGVISSQTILSTFFPSAKVGNGNYFYVYSYNAVNYFGLSAIHDLGVEAPGTSPALSIQAAYSIDKKIDDGFPQTGSVIAQYVTYPGIFWAAGGGGGYAVPPIYGASDSSATSPSATTCFDNGGNNGAAQQYSTSYAGGTAMNCALSFRFE